MTVGPIDTAYVEVKPETGGFGAELKRELDQAFRQIERLVKGSMGDVTRTFEKSGEEIEDTFKETSRAAKREYDKVEKEAKQATKQTSGHFKGMFSVLAGGFLAIGAVRVFGTFIADARESIKIGKLTAQVIESTGGAAGISAKEVSKLATAISNKTGIDDEAIQSGENLLLTFTNVRNEVGKGNDIFNQATLTIQDMSVALGQDTKSSAIQLGKALNDPIKGVTALQRVGVSFTASQKEQIKTLVESGDIMGAQKIILGELAKEFGGAAEAAATPWDKFKITMGNLGEEIGTRVIPILDTAATWLGENLPVAVENLSDFFNDTLKPAIDTAVDDFKDNLLPILEDLGDLVKDTIVPALENLAGWVQDNADFFGPFAIAIGVATTALWLYNIAAGIAAVLTGALVAPIAIAIVAIAAIAAGIVVLYQRSELFRILVQALGIIVREVWEGIWMTIQAAGRILGAVFEGIGAGIRAVRDVFNNFGDLWDLAWDGIKEAARKGVRAVVDFFLDMAEKVLNAADSAFGWIPFLKGPLKSAKKDFDKFRDDVNKSLDGVKDQTITLKVAAQSNASILATARSRGQAAGGGPIYGPGTGTSDTAGLWELSNGEHVLTAKEVQAMGGHGEVMKFRKSIRGGLARGGPASLSVVPQFPKPSYYATETAAFMGNALSIWSHAQLQAIQAAAAQAMAQAAAGTLTPGAAGFVFPLPRGSYRVGMPFGGYPGHGGQDFPAARGTPVYAPMAGMFTPISLGNRSYGNYANIMAGAIRFIGAHLRGFARGQGLVRAGERVGSVDSTGNSTGDHLHAEFRVNGHAVNPHRFLRFDLGGLVDSTGPAFLHSGEAVVNPAFPSRARDILSRVGLGGGAPVIFNQTITFEGAVPTEQQAAAVGRSLGKGVMEILERHDALQAGRFA